jgi:hypothetical protein
MMFAAAQHLSAANIAARLLVVGGEGKRRNGVLPPEAAPAVEFAMAHVAGLSASVSGARRVIEAFTLSSASFSFFDSAWVRLDIGSSWFRGKGVKGKSSKSRLLGPTSGGASRGRGCAAGDDWAGIHCNVNSGSPPSAAFLEREDRPKCRFLRRQPQKGPFSFL